MESKELEQKIYDILFMSDAANASYETNKIMALVTAEVERAKQEPVGDALEIQVNPAVMQHMVRLTKLNPKTIAKRTLTPEWRVKAWLDGSGDKYDYEVKIWQLRILADLSRKYNWAAFLIEDVSKLQHNSKKGQDKS